MNIQFNHSIMMMIIMIILIIINVCLWRETKELKQKQQHEKDVKISIYVYIYCFARRVSVCPTLEFHLWHFHRKILYSMMCTHTHTHSSLLTLPFYFFVWLLFAEISAKLESLMPLPPPLFQCQVAIRLWYDAISISLIITVSMLDTIWRRVQIFLRKTTRRKIV